MKAKGLAGVLRRTKGLSFVNANVVKNVSELVMKILPKCIAEKNQKKKPAGASPGGSESEAEDEAEEEEGIGIEFSKG